MIHFVVLNLRCYYSLVVSVHSTWTFDEGFIVKFLPQLVSQLWKQGKGAGKNSKTKEDKETKLEGGEIKSQGQFTKEGRNDLLLNREALNLIHDRSQPSLPSCHFLKKIFCSFLIFLWVNTSSSVLSVFLFAVHMTQSVSFKFLMAIPAWSGLLFSRMRIFKCARADFLFMQYLHSYICSPLGFEKVVQVSKMEHSSEGSYGDGYRFASLSL